jgi:hypothetical protein
MMRLFRVGLATVVLCGAVALAAPALSQTSDHAKAEPNLTLPPQVTPVRCALPFSAIAILPGWRILEGDRMQAYLDTMFTTSISGDALAYYVRGDKVALVLSQGGCATQRRVVPEKVHRNTVNLALGQVV